MKGPIFRGNDVCQSMLIYPVFRNSFMKRIRAWKFRLYPSKSQQKELMKSLYECKNLWNQLLDYTKKYYEETNKFPTRKQLYLLTKDTALFSQVAQNVADRLTKSLKGVIARKKVGIKAGFPRFKPIERIKSLTYPQFGFRLDKRLNVSAIGSIPIKKHRQMQGQVKILTIKKTASGKWFAVFTTETEVPATSRKTGLEAGIDLGVEHFAYLSDGKIIENPRHLKQAEKRLKKIQQQLSRKKKGSKQREKAKLRLASAYESLKNRRYDFLHKASRRLASEYSFLALENLNVAGLSRSYLAKSVLDCSWAEFAGMLAYKAEEAGCEVVLVDPAHTSQMCSKCGLVQKKSLAERRHDCPCGASMHRDLNAAINILQRATGGTPESQACREETSVHYIQNGQVASMKQEAHTFRCG